MYPPTPQQLETIRKNLKQTPKHPNELDFSPRPFRYTDIHQNPPQQDFLHHDPVSGTMWEDPPPPEFQTSSDINNRPYPSRSPQHIQSDEQILSRAPGLKPRTKLYNSLQEEEEDLWQTVEWMQSVETEQLESQWLDIQWPENEYKPDQKELNFWAEEANKRGGNVAEHATFDLPPITPKPSQQKPLLYVPSQRYHLLAAHAGSWEGRIVVVDVEGVEKWTGTVRTDLRESGTNVEWTTEVDREEGDLMGCVEWSFQGKEDALRPGRAIGTKGEYVVQGSDATVGEKVLEVLVGKGVHILGEIGGKRGKDTWKVIVLGKEANLHAFVVMGNFTGMETMLKGYWKGKGLGLHPKFPEWSVEMWETALQVEERSHIGVDEVSWGGEEIEESPEAKKKGRKMGKKRLTKRVKAAREFDRKRLETCSMMWKEKIGKDYEDVQAWRIEEASLLYSPRIGKFVKDYHGIVLPFGLVVTFVKQKTEPIGGRVIEVVMMDHQTRKRVKMGRNEQGELVGALFIEETHVEESDKLVDEVSGYV